jgi:hypothetical protein
VRRRLRHAGQSAAGFPALLALASAAAGAAALLIPASAATAAKPPPASKPPLALTGSALHAGESSVELTGTVNPKGTETIWYFQYGPTTAYGAQTPTTGEGNGTAGVKVNQIVSGLQLGAGYHYRLVAVSAAGTAEGKDRTFTTREIPLRFVLAETHVVEAYGSGAAIEGTLTGTGGAGKQVILQTNPFPYLGGFTDSGTATSTNAEGGLTLQVPRLQQTTKVRVRTLEALPEYSQTVTVQVAVLVTLRVHPGRSRGSVLLSGTVAPAEAGAAVVFQRVRPGRSPADVGHTAAGGGAAGFSRFSAEVKINRGGYYRARVEVTNGRQTTGFSRTVLLHAAPKVKRAHRAQAGRS